jgi:hypothetical protein
MNRRIRCFVLGLAGLALTFRTSTAARSDESVPTKTEETPQSEEAKARGKFMIDALGEYKVEVKEEGQSRVPKLLPTPALRWTNTVSGTKDGIVGVWTSGGRPDVVVQFAGYGASWIFHFESTSLAPLTLNHKGATLWTPKAPGVTLRPIPDAPAPADTPVKRATQMRRLAERFEVVDDFHPIYTDPKTERHVLRLLTKPLYRYEVAEKPAAENSATGNSAAGKPGTGELIDGALFGFVLGTDPEALLMIEAYKSPEATEWRYAFAPMTVYGLVARLDETEVWNRPENRVWKIDDRCFVGQHR